jgi:N4-(beta-N-acetylglucosaminyl)-L-asparaginase
MYSELPVDRNRIMTRSWRNEGNRRGAGPSTPSCVDTACLGASELFILVKIVNLALSGSLEPSPRLTAALLGNSVRDVRPVIVTSKTNPLVMEKITIAGWQALQGGGSALDAAEKAVNASELDPADVTVGYGGDPNEDGVVQLDAAVMYRGNAGAVAALEGIKTPCSIARLVMERTDHLLLVGEGAQRFAIMHGFHKEDLLTDEAREHWIAWKESRGPGSYYRSRPYKPEGGGTIAVLVVDERGELAGATSTVGHHFKIPGRVGDTPIIGAGLYVEEGVGGAGVTGHGEESIKMCASFLAVQKMREGMSPQEACRFVCQRAADRHGGHPMFNLKIIALSQDGSHGVCALRGATAADGSLIGLGCSVFDESGFHLARGIGLLPPLSDDERVNLPLR